MTRKIYWNLSIWWWPGVQDKYLIINAITITLYSLVRMRFLLLFFLVQPSLQKNLLQLGDEVTGADVNPCKGNNELFPGWGGYLCIWWWNYGPARRGRSNKLGWAGAQSRPRQLVCTYKLSKQLIPIRHYLNLIL